jgi:outer membrane lipoprotein SlyB
MRRIISFLMSLLLIFILMGCTTPRSYQGAEVGGVLGGIAGALLDRNPWRGGVIGGVLGAVAGATLTEISARAAREAVIYNQPVEYRTEDGRGIYWAEPMGYDEQTRCSKIHERVWEDGRLVKDQIREVCEGTKYEKGIQASPVEQPLVSEGFFAIKLADALKVGEVKSEAEAESKLASMGIAPRNGWIANYPLTLNIIGELEYAIGAAAESGKIGMKKDEAIKVFQNLIKDIQSQYAGFEPPPGWQPPPEPYYYSYPYPYPYPFPYVYYYPSPYWYYRHHHYHPYYRRWR